MKALVAISVSREWTETEFLMQIGTWQLPKNWQVKFGWFRQFTAAERHNLAVEETIHQYDRLLFMDTDQTYPPDYISMMLEHKEPIITALNVTRYYPFEFTTYTIDEEFDYEGITIPRFTSFKPPEDRLIYECDMTGTGALMLDPEIVKDIPRPFFKDIYDKIGSRRLLCDDFYFCWQLHKAGIKIAVDQSIVVKHTAKIDVSPHNIRDLKNAWEKINSGWGITKDGKQA